MLLGLILILWSNKKKKSSPPDFSPEQDPEESDMDDVDNMDGRVFESYVSKILESQGYYTELTPPTNDFGIDIIAKIDETKIAIQVKRHSSKISRRAISDAVTGKEYYNCDKAMVITNNYFTSSAIEIAQKTDCILVDRRGLENWIFDFKEKSNKNKHAEYCNENFNKTDLPEEIYNKIVARALKKFEKNIGAQRIFFDAEKEAYLNIINNIYKTIENDISYKTYKIFVSNSMRILPESFIEQQEIINYQIKIYKILLSYRKKGVPKNLLRKLWVYVNNNYKEDFISQERIIKEKLIKYDKEK